MKEPMRTPSTQEDTPCARTVVTPMLTTTGSGPARSPAVSASSTRPTTTSNRTTTPWRPDESDLEEMQRGCSECLGRGYVWAFVNDEPVQEPCPRCGGRA